MGTGAPLKTPDQTTNHNPIMSQNLALSLLRQGRNGAQILEILESIAADSAECAE
jgi:hypothetical protein